MSTAYSQNVPVAQQLIRNAIDILGSLPADFAPKDDGGASARITQGLGEQGLTPDQFKRLGAIYESWPGKLLHHFQQTTAVLAQVLTMFGARPVTEPLNVKDLWKLDRDAYRLMETAERLQRQPSGNAEVPVGGLMLGPAAMRRAVMDEIERRVLANRTPFSATVMAMLGPDALRWLFAPNSTGSPYLQPHEFSRAGWIRLSRIGEQIRIEQELARFGAQHLAHAKIVVCLAWASATLASLMDPEVFLTEQNPFLSSQRSGGETISVGATNHTIVRFEIRTLLNTLLVLHDGLSSEVVTACDLMWIANGLARWRSVSAGPDGERPAAQEEFGLFLSHRGRDAKSTLAHALMQDKGRSAFLDCLTLPRGVVNRCFVFGGIGRSKLIVVVDTPNFSESEWCRKELWVAERLDRLGLAKLRRCSLPEAIQNLSTADPVTRPAERPGDYPISPRILSDARYWARGPNLDTLARKKSVPSALLRAEKMAASLKSFTDDSTATKAGHEAHAVLLAAVEKSPKGKPIDLWASAAQLAAAILGLNSSARSKMEVRTRIERMNAAIEEMAGERVFAHPEFRRQASYYLGCLSAAVVCDLSGFRLDPFTTTAIRVAIGPVAILREGLLLFDVRRPGPRRDLHTRFALSALFHDISSVGILQSSDDHVHQQVVGGRQLELLPCVTMHPGMEALFPELADGDHRRSSGKGKR